MNLLFCAWSYSLMPGRPSGSGQRLMQIARGLNPWSDVAILVAPDNPVTDRDIELRVVRDVASGLAWADAVYLMDEFPDELPAAAAHAGLVVVSENHTPIEHLFYRTHDGVGPDERYLAVVARYRSQLAYADFFVVRSEVERACVVDGLVTAGRIDAAALAVDETLGHLVDVVPVGVLTSELESLAEGRRHEPRSLSGAGVCWNGGVWEFHDPVRLVRTLDAMAPVDRPIRLLFPFLPDSPSPVVEELRAVAAPASDRRVVTTLAEHPAPHLRDEVIGGAAAFACVARNSAENILCHRLRLRDSYLYRRPFIADGFGATGAFVESSGIGIALGSGRIDNDARRLRRLLTDIDAWRSCASAIDRLLPSVLLDRHCERLARRIERLLTDIARRGG